MNKKGLIIVLFVFALLTLNVCVAQETDNSTDVVDELSVSDEVTVDATDDVQVLKEYDNNVISKDNSSLNDKFECLGASSSKNVLGSTHDVASGLSNSEIQNIINNANANDVILFKGQSYSNINLVVTKCLTLKSNVGTVLKSSSSSPVITVKGANAYSTKIIGLTLEGNGNGILIDGTEYVTVYGDTITTKGNGIVALNTRYLNITKNNIVGNSKAGICLANSNDAYIFNNKITGNGGNGIEIAKSSNVYVHGNTLSGNKNGVYLGNSVNGVNYGSGPINVHINKNTITKNTNDGILVQKAGDNINIKSNNIESNKGNGISLAQIGSNAIKSNVISENDIGIKFFDNYVKPDNQDISYNAIFNNYGKDLEAKETYYQDNGVRLNVGDNWYTDLNFVCPKIQTNNIKFTVKQIGPNKYQALFTDSNGNIASLLPDRTLTYTTNNGQKITISIKGGAGVFTVDANDGDLVRATVDKSDRDNTHDVNTKSSKEINGKSPEYTYPSIPQYGSSNGGSGSGNGNGNGDGTGQGNGGNTNKGNGRSSQESNDNTGNSTHSQNMNPSNTANNQANQVSQPESAQTTSQASASDAGQASDADSGSQSVVKQIIIDEDEFFKITGISLIILLMIFTIGFYYRDDIREMKSKM